jgi:hypothetical protein
MLKHGAAACGFKEFCVWRGSGMVGIGSNGASGKATRWNTLRTELLAGATVHSGSVLLRMFVMLEHRA